jgi:hypothetical protein
MADDPIVHEPLAAYRAMWTTEREEWVLVREDAEGTPSGFLLPFNLTTRAARILDDQAVAEAVVARMVDAGVPVVDALPDP